MKAGFYLSDEKKQTISKEAVEKELKAEKEESGTV